MEMVNQKRKKNLREIFYFLKLGLAVVIFGYFGQVYNYSQSHHHEHLVKDVVCGKEVDIHEAKFTSNYKGKVYYFCSEKCKLTFDQHPEKYEKNQLSELKAEYEKNPDNIKAGLKYSQALIENGLLKEAKSLLNELLKKAKAGEELSEIYFKIGYVDTKQGNYDDALSNYAIVIENYPQSESFSGAVINTAAIKYQIKDELEPAFNLLSEALKAKRIINKHLPTAYKLMLMMNYDRGDFQAAKNYLEMMPPEETKDPHINDSIWVIYMMSGEKDKGEKLLQETYERVQNDFFGLYRLASIAYEAKIKIDEALTWIEKANKLSGGEKFYVLDTYSKLLWHIGQKVEAISLLEKAINLCKNESALVEMKARLESYKEALKK